ncbi:hypothetical protein AYO38_03350 [bacterium SCGC AG-212-C10]|nr:hypothetical protein AYO38_03350 [bacterium SCGC AG-212-C10]
MDSSKIAGPNRFRFWRQHVRTDGAGQTLVEFSLVLPIILIMMFALVDFGRAFYTWQVVTNSAREGARSAAVQLPDAQIRAAVNSSLSGLDTSKATITYPTGTPQGAKGTPIAVRVAYTFQWVTPLGSMLTLVGGSSLSAPVITSTATMRLE